jgi:histidinol-phosphatase (PHP family)
MFIDYHVHTAYSDDSDYPMEMAVLDAINLGITEICFTDHVDYGVKRDWNDPRGILYRKGGPGEPEQIPITNIDHPNYMKEISYLKKKYADHISVKFGAEFGMQQHTIPEFEKLFSQYPYDFVILSVHQINNLEFWNQEYQKHRSQEEYILGYYKELLTLVQRYANYSVLGHLDLIARYDKIGNFPFEKIRPIVTEILKYVIENDKGIEVNTSCFRYGLSDLTPSREILKLYKSLGGEILTIGSDSHKKDHLGNRIPETLKLIRELGFQTICTYEQMCPTFLKITE